MNKSGNYTQREFIDTYRENIGYIISLIKNKCQEKSFKIQDEKKLFKILIYSIFINSDTRRLTY